MDPALHYTAACVTVLVTASSMYVNVSVNATRMLLCLLLPAAHVLLLPGRITVPVTVISMWITVPVNTNRMCYCACYCQQHVC
jgi:hypothetical protein